MTRKNKIKRGCIFGDLVVTHSSFPNDSLYSMPKDWA